MTVKRTQANGPNTSPNTAPNTTPNTSQTKQGTRNTRTHRDTSSLSLDRIHDCFYISLAGDPEALVGTTSTLPPAYPSPKDVAKPPLFVFSLAHPLNRPNFLIAILPPELLQRIIQPDLVGDIRLQKNGRVSDLCNATITVSGAPLSKRRREHLRNYLEQNAQWLIGAIKNSARNIVECSIGMRNHLEGVINYTLFRDDFDRRLPAAQAYAEMGSDLIDGFSLDTACTKNPELTASLCAAFFQRLQNKFGNEPRYTWLTLLLAKHEFFDLKKRAIREEKIYDYIAIVTFLALDLVDPRMTDLGIFREIYLFLGESIADADQDYEKYRLACNANFLEGKASVNSESASKKTAASAAFASGGNEPPTGSQSDLPNADSSEDAEMRELDRRIRLITSKVCIYSLQEYVPLKHLHPELREVIDALFSEVRDQAQIVLDAQTLEDKRTAYDAAKRACDAITTDAPTIIERTRKRAEGLSELR